MASPPASLWLCIGYVAVAVAVGCGLQGDAPSIAPGDGAPEEEAAGSERAGGAPDGGAGAAAAERVPSGGAGGEESDDGAREEADLYDPAIIPEIELTLDAAAIAVLSSTDPAQKETWVHGSFKMGAITFADVGVRRKGSSTFRALPQKAALKIKLDKWIKGQKAYGLEELTLNNMVSNSSYVAERLAFYFFRSLGLPAQRANTAHLTINGEDYGIYANVETPDSKFLARVFGVKANTLYEANGCGSWMPGCERAFEIDVADTNAPDGARPDLTQLFRAVRRASNQSLLADVGARLHTTDWLRHAAAEALVGHRDGYAFGVFGSPHNYFLAGDTDGKFALVPWSVDLTFSGVPDASMPHADTLLARCKLSATCWSAYKAEVRLVAAAFEALDLVTLAKTWHAQIDPLVASDPKRETSIRRYGEKKWLLYGWLKERPNVVRAQLGL